MPYTYNSYIISSNWSAFSYIHNKKRNCLTSEKVFKLIYIYHELKKMIRILMKMNNLFDNLNENDDWGSDNNGEDVISD